VAGAGCSTRPPSIQRWWASPTRAALAPCDTLNSLPPGGDQALTADGCQVHQIIDRQGYRLAPAKAAGRVPRLVDAAGDKQKAQTIYTEGSKRIASKFNGATCSNVTAPTP